MAMSGREFTRPLLGNLGSFRSLLRAAFGLLLAAASMGAAAQTINFTFGGTITVKPGQPVFVEVRTLNSGGSPAGGGSLVWNLPSCSALSFATPPPATADGSGFTSAELIAQSPGTCTMTATWDPDFTGPQPAVMTSVPQGLQVLGPNPAQINFTSPDFFEEIQVGQTITTQVRTRLSGKPAGGGALVIEIISCPHATLVAPPTTASMSGFTDFQVQGLSSGSCEVLARWDHDNNVGTPDAVASPTLDIFVSPGPPSTSVVSGPAAIIPVTENPQFTILAERDGKPFGYANVRWEVTFQGKTTSYGGLCSSLFQTDSSGLASFDFEALKIFTQPGDWEVTAEAGDGACREEPVTRGPPPIIATFNFGVENVELTFDDAENEIQRGVLAQFNVLLRTTPSNVPVVGFPIDWDFGLNATPANSGVTPPTDSDGRASFSFTPTELGFSSIQLFEPVSKSFGSTYVDVFDLDLEVITPPPSINFTDEVANGVVVLATKLFGGNPRSGRGNSIPLGDVPVTFTITSANASFTANSSTAFTAFTQSAGEATGSTVLIGRTAQPVDLAITSPGFPTISASYATTPSNYSIEHGSAATIEVPLGSSPTLIARVLRGGVSTPAPIGAGETVTWTVTPPANGATVTPSTITDSASNATATFTPQAPGTYQVVAQFDPGIMGVSPDTVTFTVDVTGPLVTVSLQNFEGDFTRAGPGAQFPISVRYLEDGVPVTPASPQTILWSVSSGDATLAQSSSAVEPSTAIATNTVTFGSTPGPVVVLAQLAGANQIPVSTLFFLDFEEGIVFEILDPPGGRVAVAPNDPFTASLRLRNTQGAGFANKLILVSSEIPDLEPELLTDASGVAGLNGTAPSEPGRYLIEFTHELDGGGYARGGSGTTTLGQTVIVDVVAPQASARLIQSEGDGQRGLVGRPALPLRALYTLNEIPQPGTSVTWEIVSGGGTPTRQITQTDAQGIASFNYTFGSTPGPVVIRASVGEVDALFTIIGEFARFAIVSGNGQRGPVQTNADQPLVVSVLDANGVGVGNQTVSWSLTSGSAALVGGNGGGNSTQTITDSSGRAQVNLRFGSTPGAIAISANTSLAGAPLAFTAQAELPGLRIISGNNQSAEPGQNLAQDFVISIAPTQAKALGGVTIQWEVLSGGGTLTSTSTSTDTAGESRNRLRLGPQAGANQVRASIAGGPSVTFNADGLVTTVELVKVSGDNQVELPTNTDSAPLVVRLRRAGGGAPVANATIVWTGNNAGFVNPSTDVLQGQTTSVTNGQGEARIVARVIASGPAAVSARLQDSVGDPLVFSLSGAIANTPELNENQETVADVLDTACIALASLTNRTPEQNDLLQRCREFQRSSGTGPDDVGRAIEELDPDVALTMASAGLEVVTTQISNVNNYLLEARNNPAGRGQFKMTLATPDGALPLSFLPTNLLAANAAQEESAEGQDLGPDFGRWGFFASGTIGRGKFRDGSRTPDYDYDSGNLTAGVDYRLSDAIILGAGIGYSRHTTDLRDDGGELDTSGASLIGFVSWYSPKQWFVDGVLTLGRNDYDLTRNIRYSIGSVTGGTTSINQVATSDTRGDQLGASLSVGRDWQTGPWSINSYLRGNYLRTEYDAYAERLIANLPGAGLGLSVDARTLTNTSTTLGGKATYILSRDWGILMPHAQLEWDHSFDDDPSQLVARFLADPTGTTFIQTGDELDTNTFNLGVGLSALWPGGRSAYMAYERLLNSSQLKQDTLSLGVRVEF